MGSNLSHNTYLTLSVRLEPWPSSSCCLPSNTTHPICPCIDDIARRRFRLVTSRWRSLHAMPLVVVSLLPPESEPTSTTMQSYEPFLTLTHDTAPVLYLASSPIVLEAPVWAPQSRMPCHAMPCMHACVHKENLSLSCSSSHLRPESTTNWKAWT